MKKIVAASLIGLAAFAGPVDALHASPLSALANRLMPGTGKADKEVVLAQANDAMRIGQLEEQIRSLNGRIEEMSFQLLQMQEQLRKTQEDNEYRFQDLESGKGGGKSGALEKPLGQGTDTSQTAATSSRRILPPRARPTRPPPAAWPRRSRPSARSASTSRVTRSGPT